MAAAFPYTHYACPCSDRTSGAPTSIANKRLSRPVGNTKQEDRPLNPHDPQAHYSLYPLDHLLFCDECDAIRCPGCWTEEVINWYCPACLFEVPSSAVKSDGNRCARSCYNCPSCTAPLAVTTVPEAPDTHLKPSNASDEAYMLQCQFCDWSTQDVGIVFPKPTKITEQLVKQRRARNTSKDKAPPDKSGVYPPDHDETFETLTSFYKDQLNETGETQNPYGNSPYSSPGNLARIMSIYGGLSTNALKKSREKPQPMREARRESEGLSTYALEDYAEDEVLQKLESVTWEDTVSRTQQLSTPYNQATRFADQLWPVATALRTRKGKRCKECRQFLARPDPKISSLKYKIHLLALNHVPRVLFKPLHPDPSASTHPNFRLRTSDSLQADLQPLSALQYILTVRNPIFDTIKVTLGTPEITPGRVRSKVTILCPQFTVGPAGDMWDEAMSISTASSANAGGREAAMASLTGSRSADDPDRQPEAGKIWEKTRNSTSVIVEVVPGQLRLGKRAVPGQLNLPGTPSKQHPKDDEEDDLDEDDDVLEIPVYLRAEWEHTVDEQSNEINKGKAKGEKVRKGLAFWCVLGVGRIAE
ncbi:Dynactin p62-domain-containing protein [Teratosphaeria destructans]|uniref:Dynactin subunit 4 n=1 Tax=Teratosphaeria destructans TaxID=418781 RepID=A0A9W7T0Y8_9PEZI|nr:Dynactin p62-domain-containing protein [Teratosphaeria destructans]